MILDLTSDNNHYYQNKSVYQKIVCLVFYQAVTLNNTRNTKELMTIYYFNALSFRINVHILPNTVYWQEHIVTSI